VNGAAVLGTSLVLTLRSFRAGFERSVQPIRTPIASHDQGTEARGMGLSGVRP
jgi:hypothetical protein